MIILFLLPVLLPGLSPTQEHHQAQVTSRPLSFPAFLNQYDAQNLHRPRAVYSPSYHSFPVFERPQHLPPPGSDPWPSVSVQHQSEAATQPPQGKYLVT